MNQKIVWAGLAALGAGFVIGAMVVTHFDGKNKTLSGDQPIKEMEAPQSSAANTEPIGSYIPVPVQGKAGMKESSISIPAFALDFEIKIIKTREIDQTKKLWPIGGLAYSPDDQKIAFAAGQPGNQDIWVYDLAGGQLRQLTALPSDETDPDWMSDGRIIFSSNAGGTYELAMMDSQGHNKIQLTKDAGIDKRHPHGSPIPWRNEFWASGEPSLVEMDTILYQGSDRQGNHDIWLIGEKGELPTAVTQSLPYAGNAVFPVWSPNGQTMLCNVENIETAQVLEGWNPYRQTRLLTNIPMAYFPQFLPNQTRITYMKKPVDDQLYYASSNGENEKMLRLKGETRSPVAWSHDGKALAYGTAEGIIIQDVQYPLQGGMNVWQYPELKPAQFAMLERNHFVVTGQEQNLFHLWYEMSRYSFGKGYKIPAFVTVDAVLELFHLFYDYNLRHLEETIIYEQLCQWVDQTEEWVIRARIGQGAPSEYRTNLLMWEKYFKVAQILLEKDVKKAVPTVEKSQWDGREGEVYDHDKLTDEDIEAATYSSDPVIQAELTRVFQHRGVADSEMFNRKINYSHFTVRGHYTDSARLKAYFRTMTWLGQITFNQPSDGEENITGLQRLLTFVLLMSQDARLPEQWNKIFDEVSFFVGEPEDLTLPRVLEILHHSGIQSSADIYDDLKVKKAMAQLRQMPKPKIVPKTGVCFSVFPQRFTIDSYIHQSLVMTPNGNQVGTAENPRVFPKGLDIFAAFGSERAYAILDKQLQETAYKNYPEIMRGLKQEMSILPESQWWHNAYWGWLDTLKSVIEPVDASMPAFMQNDAWLDKSLATVLASWTELRHDTILYVKQVCAEGGEGGEGWEPAIPEPKGYVEPNVVFYRRMQKLIEMNVGELKAADRMGNDALEKAGKFLEIVKKLEAIAVKERYQTPLSKEDYQYLFDFGSELEYLTAFYKGGPVPFYAGRTALVADVSAYQETYLHEAVGNVRAMLVTVPIDGHLQVNRGGVFTYYEFLEQGKRLTDVEWRKRLDDHTAPAMPSWVKSFTDEP